MRNFFLWTIVAVVLLAAIASGPIASNVEQANYRVIESAGATELREYQPMIVAEVQIEGQREKAISEGFRSIADYIFGNNIAVEKVARTGPMTQQVSEKIAMTAPVTQTGEDGTWVVRFVMPASYTLQTLPQPQNPAIKLKEIGKKYFAVIRFSGRGNNAALEKQTLTLQSFINDRKRKIVSKPIYAFFNPPWTLPFLRRNEVMLEIEKD